MKKARFKTKLRKAQKRKIIQFSLAVFMCCYAFALFFGSSLGIYDDWTYAEIYLITLAMTVFILIMLLFPLMIKAVLLGAQRGKAKRVRENTTFLPAGIQPPFTAKYIPFMNWV